MLEKISIAPLRVRDGCSAAAALSRTLFSVRFYGHCTVPEMGDLTRWEERVLTDYNLSGFLSWSSHRATVEELTWAYEHLYTLDHQGFGDDTPPPSFSKHGREWVLKSKRCCNVQCIRCLSKKGGYRFAWVDSRWTEWRWVHPWWDTDSPNLFRYKVQQSYREEADERTRQEERSRNQEIARTVPVADTSPRST